MNRITESHLIDFCVEQKKSFNPQLWIEYRQASRHTTSDELVACALFLAGADWYGHKEKLLVVAENLKAGCIGNFGLMVKTTGFDCGRFSGLLKARLRHESCIS